MGVNLESHFDLLGERSFGELYLHLGHHRRRYHAPTGTHGAGLLTHPRYNGKVVRELLSHDACDSTLIEFFGCF